MSPFRFRLQKLLEIRETTERECARRLAEAQAAMAAERERLHALEAARREAAEKASRAGASGPKAGHLQSLGRMLEQLSERIDAARESWQESQKVVDRTRAEYEQAISERRALDQLRERRLEDWRTDQQTFERRHMDDVALSRFVRSGSGVAGSER